MALIWRLFVQASSRRLGEYKRRKKKSQVVIVGRRLYTITAGWLAAPAAPSPNWVPTRESAPLQGEHETTSIFCSLSLSSSLSLTFTIYKYCIDTTPSNNRKKSKSNREKELE